MATETPPRQPLQRETVNLTPRGADALETAVRLSRDNKTDTINRAIQVLAYLLQAAAQGDEVLVRHNMEHGSVTEPVRIEFL